MDKKFRFVIRDISTGEKFAIIFNMQSILLGCTNLYYAENSQYEILSIDQETGLKDTDNNTIFENDLLFSNQFVKPVIVTYYEKLGMWMDNTYTEELCKSIHKFDLKVIGNKFENEDLLE